jgi:hypothetical protein
MLREIILVGMLLATVSKSIRKILNLILNLKKNRFMEPAKQSQMNVLLHLDPQF